MPIELTAEDKLAARRLNGLLDYVEALIKLDERPATQLAQHKLADGSQFILHQHELAGLPGITFDISDPDGPIWVRMERLQRTTPPQADAACRAWVDVSNDPTKPPVIRDAQHLRVLKAEKDRMIQASEARLDDCVPSVKPAKKDETPGVLFRNGPGRRLDNGRTARPGLADSLRPAASLRRPSLAPTRKLPPAASRAALFRSCCHRAFRAGDYFAGSPSCARAFRAPA